MEESNQSHDLEREDPQNHMNEGGSELVCEGDSAELEKGGENPSFLTLTCRMCGDSVPMDEVDLHAHKCFQGAISTTSSSDIYKPLHLSLPFPNSSTTTPSGPSPSSVPLPNQSNSSFLSLLFSRFSIFHGSTVPAQVIFILLKSH